MAGWELEQGHLARQYLAEARETGERAQDPPLPTFNVQVGDPERVCRGLCKSGPPQQDSSAGETTGLLAALDPPKSPLLLSWGKPGSVARAISISPHRYFLSL